MPESSQGVIEYAINQGGASTTEHTVEANVKIAADAYETEEVPVVVTGDVLGYGGDFVSYGGDRVGYG